MLVFGCDPGYSGAVVALYDGVCVGVFPTTKVKFPLLTDWLWETANKYDVAPTVIVERVHGGAFGGTNRKAGASSMFTFGESNGRLLQALVVLKKLNPVITLVTPQVWQKYFELPPTKNFNNAYAKKTKHLEYAVSLATAHQPEGRPPDFLNRRNADAYLMGMYGWLK